jgi:hypothetical protein
MLILTFCWTGEQRYFQSGRRDGFPVRVEWRKMAWTKMYLTLTGHTSVGAGKKATFAVYEVPVEEGNDSLSKMLGEEEG